MFYLLWKGHTIDILKCANCKRYDLDMSPTEFHVGYDKWRAYMYECRDCGESGTIRIASDFEMEAFETIEEQQERIEEIKSLWLP